MTENGPHSMEDSTYETSDLGVIIVDHGSRRSQSNEMLLQVVHLFQTSSRYKIVEPAHMELAEPSIATAFDRCVSQGARLVIINPYFLLPGRHWSQDIPALAADVAQRHSGIRFLVTAPLGLHPLMAQIMQSRIDHCLAHVKGEAGPCDVCQGTDHCRMFQVEGARSDKEQDAEK